MHSWRGAAVIWPDGRGRDTRLRYGNAAAQRGRGPRRPHPARILGRARRGRSAPPRSRPARRDRARGRGGRWLGGGRPDRGRRRPRAPSPGCGSGSRRPGRSPRRGLPLVGVSSLAALGRRHRRARRRARAGWPSIDAKRGEAFAALYERRRRVDLGPAGRRRRRSSRERLAERRRSRWRPATARYDFASSSRPSAWRSRAPTDHGHRIAAAAICAARRAGRARGAGGDRARLPEKTRRGALA